MSDNAAPRGRPSPTQAAFLKAAATPGPLGGRATVDRYEGGHWRPTSGVDGEFSTPTVRACLARGWVEECGWRYNTRGRFCVSVAITPAGRLALKEVADAT